MGLTVFQGDIVIFHTVFLGFYRSSFIVTLYPSETIIGDLDCPIPPVKPEDRLVGQ